MMRRRRSRGSFGVLGPAALLGVLVAGGPALGGSPEARAPLGVRAPLDGETAQKLDAMARKAIAYLRSKQDPDSGAWGYRKDAPTFPAITGLVVNGMIMQPGLGPRDPSIARGVRYLTGIVQPDGGIYDRVLPSYNTSICVSALTRVGTPEALGPVPGAVEFLKSLQWSEDALVEGPAAGETRRVDRDHPFYGGIGYGRGGRPDLSNLNFFMQAMRDAEVAEGDPAYQRALVFLSRVQMDERVNDREYAKGSRQGGFAYSTGVNKDTAGQGQSFAGEIAESLSGPPGTAARVTLGPGSDGKPRLATREEVRAKAAAALRASKGAGADAADQIVVLLGPTADGVKASSFEVRTPVAEAGALEAALREGLGEWLGKGTVSVEAVPAWRGESRLRAYGSMTYGGFKSLIHAGLKADDPRVVAAREWIGRNYTLAENPGIGVDGMYYYFLTFARCLDAWGEATIETVGPGGERVARDWRKDLVEQLSTLQNPDGSFRPVGDRWMENDPVLITAYALLALQHAR